MRVFVERGKITDKPVQASSGNVRVSIEDGERFTAFVEPDHPLASCDKGDIVDLGASLRVNRSGNNVYLNLSDVESVQLYELKKKKS